MSIGKALQDAIQQAGLTTQNIDLSIPHQADARIIASAVKFAEVPEDKIFFNIRKNGNPTVALIPIALTEAMEKDVPRMDLHLPSSLLERV